MFKMNRVLQVATSVSVFITFPAIAYAGFEWTPPLQGEAVISNTQQLPTQSTNVAVPRTSVEIEPFPLEQESSAGIEQAQTVTELEIQEAGDFDVVTGFGKDIPLVFALRQIAPPEYAFSFDDSVEQATLIDWNGGKPWNMVLKEALSPIGLGVSIVNKTVWIRLATSEDIDAEPVLESSLPVFDAPDAEEYSEPFDVVHKQETVSVREEDIREEPKLQEAVAYPALSEIQKPSQIYAGNDYNPSYPRRQPMPITKEAGFPKEASQHITEIKATPPEMPIDHSQSSNTYEPVNYGQSDSTDSVPGFYKEAPSKAGEKNLDPYEIYFWQAEKGDSLRETLMVWAGQAGAEMVWGALYDYRLPTSVRMHGTFPDAVRSVLTIYESSSDRPLGRLHSNLPTGPSVLVIENETMTQ